MKAASGSRNGAHYGMSTTIGLIELFYDPAQGDVLIDGINIKELNIGHKVGCRRPGEQPANAHQFISQFPSGYDTLVGEGGALFSGGQKQRIAIARAIIRNQDVLLLDEAASALDAAWERLVQDALNRLSANRTTIYIAHRLSTVRNCDQIYVVREDVVSENSTR
ncbi:hypothetical protein GGI17_006356 [Coemansia sp. S146]|nr:hypothetical protein GGI17_006356 [Coemansia sp. S146]